MADRCDRLFLESGYTLSICERIDGHSPPDVHPAAEKMSRTLLRVVLNVSRHCWQAQIGSWAILLWEERIRHGLPDLDGF